MAFPSDTICAICCKRFSTSHSNFGQLFHFQKLCSSLNAVAVSVGGGATTASAKIKINSANGREKKLNNLSTISSEMTNKLITAICPACIVCVSSTLTKRDQLNSLEVEVRQLQMKILELLSSLQASVKAFKTEVDKMEAMVEGSRDNVCNLDNFYCSGKKQDEKKDGDLLKDVIQFREKVLTVFEDLRNFSNNLESFSAPERTATDHYSAENTDKNAASPKDGFTVTDDKRSRGKKRKPVRKETPVNEEETKKICDLNEDNGAPDNDLMADRYSGEEEALDSGDCGVTLNSPSCSGRQSDNEEISADEQEDDDEYLPAKSCLKKAKINLADKDTLLQTMDFSQMSTFKTILLSRIIKRMEKLQNEQKDKDNVNNKCQQKTLSEKLSLDDIDPLKIYFYKYDPAEADILNLCDIKITINEQEKSLHCTKCDFKCYQITTNRGHGSLLEKTMYDHIVGHHLKLFTCPQCPNRHWSSYRRFSNHVHGHNNRYACDICGKPLSDSATLNAHKWSHLNEQEKADAVKNGAKSPEKKYRHYKETKEKKYQCSTCGKGFLWPNYLKRHEEEMHQSNKSHMCSECGKTYKTRNNLLSHLKYVCYPDKGKVPVHRLKRFPCDQCSLLFRTPNEVRKHKRVVHSTELHKCSQCEKMFKTKVSVTHHERTHSDARPFLCGKGCGATYKEKNHCRRHEKKCGYN